ncbi:hypothetical protein ACOMHN_009238 [Nucella lapillus]
MTDYRPSTDPVPSPDPRPSLTQPETQTSEKDVSSKVAAATVVQITDHNGMETVTNNKVCDAPPPSILCLLMPNTTPPRIQLYPHLKKTNKPILNLGSDAVVSTSVETPDIPTSTGSLRPQQCRPSGGH